MTGVTEEAAPPANPSRWFGLGRSARHDAKMVENSFTIFLFGSPGRNFSPKKIRLPCPSPIGPPSPHRMGRGIKGEVVFGRVSVLRSGVR